jgi:APA family basic amino acid/polyamine antiporter
VHTPHLVRDLVVAVVALVFSVLFIWYSRNTGHGFWVYWAPFLMAAAALLLGIPVYLAQRRHLTAPPSTPPYR